jgi:hypothetical protein
VVEGDIGEEGLGLSEEDRDLITSKVRARSPLPQRCVHCLRLVSGLGLTSCAPFGWLVGRCLQATVILHMAATTRFTEHLQLSIEMNALGGLRVLRLAKQCSRLRALGTHSPARSLPPRARAWSHTASALLSSLHLNAFSARVDVLRQLHALGTTGL